MLLPVLSILWAYLLVGFLGIYIVNRERSRDENRRLWLKFFSYAAIVHAILFSMAWDAGRIWLGLAVLIAAIGLYEIVRLHGRHREGRVVAVWGGVSIYCVIAAGFIAFAWRVPAAWQMAVYLVVCVFDGFSQLTGQLLGRHKLAPSISPAKTVEGSAGGLVVAVLTGWVVGGFAGFSASASVGYSAGIGVAALAGDLLASRYKRLQGAKDFSGLIPAHGGVLDRFDSALMAGAAVFVAYMASADTSGIWRTLLLGLAFLIILGASELMHSAGVRGEITRKFTHCGGGLLALAVPALSLTAWQAMTLGLAISLLFVIAKRRDWLKSVDPIGRRASWGSYSFPLGICVCYLGFLGHGHYAWYGISVLVLVFSDPIAMLVGTRWPMGRWRVWGQSKSLAGTGAFIASAFLIALTLLAWDGGAVHWSNLIGDAAWVAIGAALAELLTPYGLDNVAIPAVALGMLYAMPF